MENINLAQIGIEGGIILAAIALLEKQISDINSRIDQLDKRFSEDVQVVALYSSTVEKKHVAAINNVIEQTQKLNTAVTQIGNHLRGSNQPQSQNQQPEQTRGRQQTQDDKHVRFEESPPRPSLNQKRNTKSSTPVIEELDTDEELDSDDIMNDIIESDEDEPEPLPEKRKGKGKVMNNTKSKKKTAIEDPIKAKLIPPDNRSKPKRSTAEILAEARREHGNIDD